MQAHQQAALRREIACFHRHDVKTTKHRTPGDQLRSAKALPNEYTASTTTILFTVGALSVTRVASMTQNTSTPKHLELAVDLVSAYVSHNPLPASDLPSLIEAVHTALRRMGSEKAEQPAEAPPRPAVPIRKSITPDRLISLEDGRPYQSLKRHLAARGLTPEAYRAKWGLPPSYPMVAPNYAQRRSDLAKARGFGQRRPAEPTPAEGKPPPSGRRGRKKAA
jgi:predicted transcriptional regulator